MIPRGERWYEKLSPPIKKKIDDACSRSYALGHDRGVERQKEETTKILRDLLQVDVSLSADDSEVIVPRSRS